MFVDVTVRSNDPDVPTEMVRGFVPDEIGPGCPLAVTPGVRYDYEKGEWLPTDCAWRITHRPTGYHLGHEKTWTTAEAAMRVLLACDPTFAAWPLAKGGTIDPATVACKYKFRITCGAAK